MQESPGPPMRILIAPVLRFSGAKTTEPRWQIYDFVPAAGETTLKGVSTDNHFFAVRAVGKTGARSIAVVTEME